jgi:glycosyltransferase involved in cell wall biosynthesis
VYGRSRLLAAWNRSYLRRVKAVVVLGESLRRVFEGMVPDERIRIVPNCADDELFLDPEAVRAKHAGDGPLEVVFLSNMIRSKGWPEILEAAELLERSGRTGVRFTFAGAFPEESDRTRFHERAGRLSNVRYAGLVEGPERKDLLARSHVLCLPTFYPYEGQPLCILEAYASGCAVITTRQGGIPDVFRDGANGYAVEPRSPATVASAVSRAAERRSEIARMAASNREYAESFRRRRYVADLRSLLLGEENEGAGTAGRG